ncbi:hypothetical protein CC80DRAFT_563768 [Byssothecium circinans]|uniref:TolA, Membrane protein involved in colicin uptake n=1 Tax=Byssothecium circinans TaxID=147558 RepID=A0A6A5TU24_9PLEO|nr:hypothetical protein CC80DRAFT_563768 [Byssothecium circinans]
MDPEVILKRFTQEESKEQDEDKAGPSALKESDWRQMDRLIRSAIKDKGAKELKEALTAKEKHKKRGKPLDLQQREEYHGGAVFWSPRKIREARARETVKQREEHEEQLAKANRKELAAAAKLYREQQAQERRVAREAAKVVREREKAEKEAARAARIEAQNTKRASQTAQKGKRKTSGPPPSKHKRQRRSGGSAAVAASPEATPAAPPKGGYCI